MIIPLTLAPTSSMIPAASTPPVATNGRKEIPTCCGVMIHTRELWGLIRNASNEQLI